MGWNKSYGTEDRVWSGRFARHGFRNRDGVGLDEQAGWVEQLRAEWPVPVEAIKVRRHRNPRHAWARAGGQTYGAVTSFGSAFGAAGVAHEFAHIVAHDRGHGPMWRRCYVEAVAILLGPWQADRLRNAFDADGLRVSSLVEFAAACHKTERAALDAAARSGEGVVEPPV